MVGCKVDTGFAINVICIAWWKWSCLADVPQCDSVCWKQLEKWTKCFACSLIFVLQFKWINRQTSWHIRQQRKMLCYKSVTVTQIYVSWKPLFAVPDVPLPIERQNIFLSWIPLSFKLVNDYFNKHLKPMTNGKQMIFNHLNRYLLVHVFA